MEKLKQQVYDELLVLRSQDGENEAFDELIRRFQRGMWRQAFRLTESEDAAWDMVQETWLAVIKGIRRLDDPAVFRTWLYRILVRKCADWVRRQQRGRNLSTTLKGETERPMDSSAEDNSEARAVHRALGRLPYDCKLILSMRYLEEFNLTEIAEVLRIPVGTAKSRLFHARKLMKLEFETNL